MPETTWAGAGETCLNAVVGGRAGWRLATTEELMSLYDVSRSNPDASLPAGAPFTNSVDPDGYWTSTDALVNPGVSAFVVDFLGGSAGLPGNGASADAKSNSTAYRPWCVRGGNGDDHG